MQHGGDLISFNHYFDGDLIDFSSNINPLGYPQGLEDEIIKGFSKLKQYPDLHYRKLKASTAKYLGCDENEMILGNGSVEIIDAFTITADRIVICTPCFSEYKLRAQAHKKKCISIPLNYDFSIDVKKLKSTLKKNDLLILANPNNPTGLCIPQKKMLEIYKIVIDKNCFLLLDEAFFELSLCKYNSVEVFKNKSFKNVAIIRAATKFFGLPGIRLGYACTNHDTAKIVSSFQLPWSINSLAEIAGLYIFNQIDFIAKSKMYLNKQRAFLVENLASLKSIKLFNSECNFILIQLIKSSEEYVFEFMAKRGIIVRKANNFFTAKNKWAVEEFIRIAVRTEKENQKLVSAFIEFDKSVI